MCVFVSVYVANVCVCVLGREVGNDSRGRGMGARASNTRENARPRLSKRPKGKRREERADFGMLVFLHLLQNRINSPSLFSVLSLETC